MQLKLLVVGETKESYLKTGMTDYLTRLKKYASVSYQEIKDIKNASAMQTEVIKRKEGEEILKNIQEGDYLVLLDDKGKSFTSLLFAEYLQTKMNLSIKRLIFVIGGAYGFSDEVYQRANEKMSLSAMTFSHQLVRLIFLEQLYRGYSILNNSPYHHE
jgi:23S rRNA (pseudouridine1915-N3)-methyltransferase